MGIRDLFSKKEVFSTEEKKIVLALMTLRIARRYQTSGHSERDAQRKTEAIMLFQNLSGSKLLEAPDAIIVKIVKDYVKNMTANLNAAKSRRVEVDLKDLKTFVIKTIDDHRNRVLSLGESTSVPDDLDGFILYRIRREVEAVTGENPEGLGFSNPTVKMMTDIVKAVYQPTIDFKL